jgi:superfamily II DNA/RNA helicase
MDKVELLARVLQAEGRGLTVVFCRTKRRAQALSDDLAERGFAAGAVHGDLGQGAREQALRAFRNQKIDILVATDVAARGIDVEGVTHVVNYECPEDEKTYLHRIGRTGRAGASGVSVTFVDWEDTHRWGMINTALGLAFPEPIETYSTSPHVFAGLGIPEGTKGRLPRAARVRAGLDAEVLEDLGGKAPRAKTRPRQGTAEKPAQQPSRKSGPRKRTRGGAGTDAAAKSDVATSSVSTAERATGDNDGDGAGAAAKPRSSRTRSRSRTRRGAKVHSENSSGPDLSGGASAE